MKTKCPVEELISQRKCLQWKERYSPKSMANKEMLDQKIKERIKNFCETWEFLIVQFGEDDSKK